MKSFITVLLITSFVGLAVFGLFMMHGAEHEICPIAVLYGVECALVSNPLQLATIHLSSFLALSSTTLLTLVLTVLALGLGIFIQDSRPPDPFQYYQHRVPRASRFRILLRHWFSLLEHSPTA